MAESSAPSTAASQAAASKLAGMRPPSAAPAAAAAEPEAAAPSGDKSKTDKKGKKKVADEGEGTKKKKPPIKPIAIGVVLLLVAKIVMGKVEKPHYGPLNPVKPGKIYDFPASVTTDLTDGSLAQVAISLQLTKIASSKILMKDNSELMSTAVGIIGSRSYATLLSPAGRVALKASLLVAFQIELGTTEGAQQVSGVYFTSFVLQQQ